MDLKDLGFEGKIKELITGSNKDNSQIGRVIVEHKERYVVQTNDNTYHAEITGNLRFAAQSRLDFPAVGDWVKLITYDEGIALIMEIFPRISILERQAVGKFGERQIIATNVDYAFIMQSVGHDFNLNRLERYLAICNSSNIKPIIVLNKIDLISNTELEDLEKQIKTRIKNVDVLPISNETLDGYNRLKTLIEKSKTYCILGSSGVGKSTLINNLFEKQLMETKSISENTNKGRHTTSHRELFILEKGGIIIDTPGMRELGITNDVESIEQTYNDIAELSKQCKFNDCTHINEEDCAVLRAVENGEIDNKVLENYHKLKREQAHFESTVKEKREKDKKQGKLYKTIMQVKKKSKGNL